MNDTKIIKIISIIHITIVSIVFFIIFTLSLMFISLHNGISVNTYSNKYVKIEQLYIKWNEKLHFSLKKLEIKTQKSDDTKIDIHQLTKNISNSALFIRIFKNLDIDTIHFNDLNASFHYKEDKGGIIQATSQNFNFYSKLNPAKEKLYISIEKLHFNKQNTDVTGTILLHNYKVQTSLLIDINHDIALQLDAISNQKRLKYNIKSLKKIKSINYLLTQIHLPPSINYWIDDAITMSSLDIEKFYGFIDYNKMKNALDNLHVKAKIHNLDYKYNKTLDAIHTKYTELLFKNGALYIYPKVAYTYGQFLGKSWVKIDFSKTPFILSIHLNFKGILNNDVLNILKAYKIKLPFLQKKGKVDVKLNIDIDLQHLKVQTDGNFYTDKANFDYMGLNIDIYHAKIFLKNYDVKIDNMLAHYGKMAVSDVDVRFHADTKSGIINFHAKEINLDAINLQMKDAPLHISYHIIPHHNYIDIDTSSWNFLGYQLTINPLKIPFDTEKLLLKIPTTKIKIKDMATIYTSGELLLPSLKSYFNLDVVAFNYLGLKLYDKKIKMQLLYDKILSITTQKEIRLKNKNRILTLNNNTLSIKNNILNLQLEKVQLNNLFHTQFGLKYNLTTKNGIIKTKDLEVTLPNKKNLLTLQKAQLFQIDNSKNDMKIRNYALSLTLQKTPELIALRVNNLIPLLQKSPLLKATKLDIKHLNVIKNTKSDLINYSCQLKSPYKILVNNDTPLDKYNLSGIYNTQTTQTKFTIDNKVKVNIDKNTTIEMENIGINLLALKKLSDTQEKNNTSSTSSNYNINIHAKDSYLFISKNRKILSDDIDIKYKDNNLISLLTYKKAKAILRYKAGKFSLYGKNFNDNFMSHLFSLSKFKGGKLDFSLSGTVKEYIGTFNIQNTTVLEYKLLNNILAFVNTIPSLMTFSLPGYDANGLYVKNSYLNFSAKDDIFHISDIYLDSKEIDILGHGDASFVKNSIDLELNLKTDLGSTVSKIPVVGYILLDKDSISTTVKVYGPLDDPKVKSLLAKEIIVAPLNIIKRTIMLPFHLFSNKKK